MITEDVFNEENDLSKHPDTNNKEHEQEQEQKQKQELKEEKMEDTPGEPLNEDETAEILNQNLKVILNKTFYDTDEDN